MTMILLLLCCIAVVYSAPSIDSGGSSIVSRYASPLPTPSYSLITSDTLNDPYFGNRIVIESLSPDSVVQIDFNNTSVSPTVRSTSAKGGECDLPQQTGSIYKLFATKTTSPLTCVVYFSYDSMDPSGAPVSISYAETIISEMELLATLDYPTADAEIALSIQAPTDGVLIESVPYTATLSLTAVTLAADHRLFLAPAHATLRYTPTDCTDEDGTVLLRHDSLESLAPLSGLTSASLSCSFTLIIRATPAAASTDTQHALEHLAVRVDGGDTALYPMAQQGLSFQRMRASLVRSSTPAPAVGSPADLALSLAAPMKEGDLLFLQFSPGAAVSLHTAAGFTTAACAEDASLAVLEPRSPSRLQIRLLRDVPALACTFTVTPATPVSRSAPAPVLSVPRYGAALELPSPLVMVDASRTLDVSFLSIPMQMMGDTADIAVTLLPSPSDSGALVFTVPYVAEFRGRRPKFVSKCLSGRDVVALVDADVPRFTTDDAGDTTGVFDTVLRLTFPAGAYKPRSQGPTACTIAFYVNEAESFYFLRPEGPDGDVEMTVPYGSPETCPIFALGSLVMQTLADGANVVSVAMPDISHTAARWSLKILGFDFPSLFIATKFTNFVDRSIASTDVFDFALDDQQQLTLTLKTERDVPNPGGFYIMMPYPKSVISLYEVSGTAPALLVSFHNPWFEALVNMDCTEPGVVTANNMQLSWNLEMRGVFTETQDFVYMKFQSYLNITALDADCSPGVSATMMPAAAEDHIKLVVQGGAAGETATCAIKTISNVSPTAPSLALLRVLLSSDNETYHQARSNSLSPLLFHPSHFSFRPQSDVAYGTPVDWQFDFLIPDDWQNHLHAGDTITFNSTAPFAGVGETVECTDINTSTRAFSCLVAEPTRIVCTSLVEAGCSCTLPLVSASRVRATTSFHVEFSLAQPSTLLPLYITLPDAVDVFAAAPTLTGDSLRSGLRVDVALHASLGPLLPGDAITLAWALPAGAMVGEAFAASLTVVGPACLGPDNKSFCSASVAYDGGHTLLTLRMLENVPQDAEEASFTLPLYFGASGVLPEALSLRSGEKVLTASLPLTFTAAPVAQALLSAGPASAEDQLLLLEAAQPLHGAVRVSGLQLPAGTAEVVLRDCGEGAVAGTAAVDDDGVITVDADTISFAKGSTCTVILPAATSASDWLTITTADGDCTFPSSRPDHAVTVTPPSAIVTWADYPLRFQFPRLQLSGDSDRLFAFVSNAEARSCSVACSLADAAGGSWVDIDASITVAPGPDADAAHPFVYRVSAAIADADARFLALDCTATLRFDTLDPDADYSLLVSAIGREDANSPSPHALGKPQAEAQPSITVEQVDSLQLDFVVSQMRMYNYMGIRVKPADGSSTPLFTHITCGDDATPFLDETLFLRINREFPLSLTPVRLRCSAFLNEDAMGTSIVFLSGQLNIPPATLPVLPHPSPKITLTTVSNTLIIDIQSFEARRLTARLERPADRRRVAKVWSSPGCAAPTTVYIDDREAVVHADDGEAVGRFATDWAMQAPVDASVAAQCRFFVDFIYSLGDDTSLTVLVDEVEMAMTLDIPTLEAVLPVISVASVATVKQMQLISTIIFDNSFISAVEVTNVWPEVVNEQNTNSYDRLFLSDGASVYALPGNRLQFVRPAEPTFSGASVFDLKYGAWPIQPSGSRFSLYVDGIEYAGTYAPPPSSTYSLVVRQPVTAAAKGNYVIEVTFAAPVLARPELSLHMDISSLPVTDTASCTVEGVPVASTSDARVIAVPLAAHRSHGPGAGSMPLSLPHVTARCSLPLQAEAEVMRGKERSFPVWVRGAGEELMRTHVVMPVPADTTMAVRFHLPLQGEDSLNRAILASVRQAVAGAVAKRVLGLVTEQVVLLPLERSKGRTTVPVKVISRERISVTVEAVQAALGDVVTAVSTLGYEVANIDKSEVSGQLVDAACSYTCGAGCHLCDDDASCAWDLDCLSGACHEGVCRTPAPAPRDLTWLWVILSAAAATVIVGAAVAGVLRVKRVLRERSREALLHGHYEMDEDV